MRQACLEQLSKESSPLIRRAGAQARCRSGARVIAPSRFHAILRWPAGEQTHGASELRRTAACQVSGLLLCSLTG